MSLNKITENATLAFEELKIINTEIIAIANSLKEERMREGLIYLKIDSKQGVAYPRWAVLLFSKKNGKAFSKSLGTRLTKQIIKQAHNGRRTQRLLEAATKIKALIERRKRINNALKAARVRLGALFGQSRDKEPEGLS